LRVLAGPELLTASGRGQEPSSAKGNQMAVLQELIDWYR